MREWKGDCQGGFVLRLKDAYFDCREFSTPGQKIVKEKGVEPTMNYNQPPIMRPPQNEATNQTAMLLHLSQLLGHTAIPVLGWLVPILIWQFKKNEMPGIDAHGKSVANWMLTELIAGVIFGFLCFFLIGFPLLFALYILGIIFPIIGGIKANNGEVWDYPLTIKFFK